MKKIIHLSDLHIGYEDCGAKFRQIVENITLLKQPSKNYVIVITGDIVDNATHEAQMVEALDAIDELKKRGYDVLPIPGNHDYGTGSWGHKKYIELFKKTFYGSSDFEYPKVDIIDKILFVGLDSTAEELHWYDCMLSQGEIGEGQLKELECIINKAEYSKLKKVIYLHHHPFDFEIAMSLKDRKKLRLIIENKIDALLFGHYHGDFNNAGKNFNGTWGIPRAYNAGSTTHKQGNTGIHRIINLKTMAREDYDGIFI